VNKLLRILSQLRLSVRKPIFQGSKDSCHGLHTWTHISNIINKSDEKILKRVCQTKDIGALSSLAKGNLICQECGHVAHYNVHVNIDNLVQNLRIMDTQKSR